MTFSTSKKLLQAFICGSILLGLLSCTAPGGNAPDLTTSGKSSGGGSNLPYVLLTGGTRYWSDATYAATCKDYISPSAGYSYSGDTGDGVYRISPSGSPYDVYCDMTTDSGGWILVAGISSANHNHITSGAVTSGNLLTAAGIGKYADAQINSLATSMFRLNCSPSVGYFSSTCSFGAATQASGVCTAMAYTYNGSYGGQFSENLMWGVAQGDQGSGQRLVYGNPAFNGCGSSSSWNNAGTLWVK